MDKDRINQRLDDLRREYAEGETQLRALDERKAALQQTLYRIAGAIQVLEEMLAE
jgi:hypothetical protein